MFIAILLADRIFSKDGESVHYNTDNYLIPKVSGSRSENSEIPVIVGGPELQQLNPDWLPSEFYTQSTVWAGA
jgi:hypothetical protein